MVTYLAERSLVISALAALALASPACAELCDAWIEQFPGAHPTGRAFFALAADTSRDVLVLFGGTDGVVKLGDTWEWDGSDWQQVATSGPPARSHSAMAYDSDHNVSVLFGGSGASGALNDTWVWNGTAWSDVTTSGPGQRNGHTMVYDKARHVAVLFGGAPPPPNPPLAGLLDTWLWDGSVWTRAYPEHNPVRGVGAAMAYDEHNEVGVLLGGRGCVLGSIDKTYTWNGTDWTEVFPGASPTARSWHGMAYDSDRDVVVMFGGASDSDTDLSDTWEWDGANWADRTAATAPSARRSALAYHSPSGRIVLFGGAGAQTYADTWTYWPTPLERLEIHDFNFAPQNPTTGASVATFAGRGFVSGMSVVFKSAVYAQPARPEDVTANVEGTFMSVVVPAFPPGCDCSSGAPIETDILFDNECSTATLVSAGGLFTYDISSILVSNQYGVQSAIDAAAPGTCIKLQAGVNFNGPVIVGTGRERITLTSTNPNEPGLTQINAFWSAPTISFEAHGPGVCISGLNLIMGNSGALISGDVGTLVKGCQFDDNVGGTGMGGGLTISNGAHPIVWNCEILFNEATGGGGGIRVENASPVIYNNSIHDNPTAGDGGGMYLSHTGADTTVVANQISGNASATAANGGGVFWTGSESAPSVGYMAQNEIRENWYSGLGGGLYLGTWVTVDVVNNVFRSNVGTEVTSQGGAIYVDELNRNLFVICGNVMFNNNAEVGGAVVLRRKCEAALWSNIIYCNTATDHDPQNPDTYYAAGVLADDAGPSIRHNTILRNTGASIDDSGGIHLNNPGTGYLVLEDNLVARNNNWELFSNIEFNREVDYDLLWDPEDARMVTASFANLGPHMLLNVDPEFATEPSCSWPGTLLGAFQQFALGPGSPAGGAASDGRDIGAVQALYDPLDPGECVAPSYPPGRDDCNGNGVPDFADFQMGLVQDTNRNGAPDACEVCRGDLNCDGLVNFNDIGPFVQRLGNAQAYWAQFPHCPDANGDVNRDGLVDFNDINALVALLGQTPPPTCPNP